jgi:hypothetical protein
MSPFDTVNSGDAASLKTNKRKALAVAKTPNQEEAP